jgi:hypothetical protein
MPAVNHIVLASGAVVAVSVVVATAMAIYENPEVRRYTDDARRRIALALQSLSDGINPPIREPRFNRPEDAEGFMQTKRGQGAEPGVDADEATRKSQRQELMYWNAVKLQKQLEDELARRALGGAPAEGERPSIGERGTSFDDFLKPAESDEQGAYVFNSGAEVRSAPEGLRQRGEGARGLAAAALYTNPFADENHIDIDELDGNMGIGTGRSMPGGFDASDIYSATTRDDDHQTTETMSATMEEATPALIDVSVETIQSSATSGGPFSEDQSATASRESDDEAYASIQAWAHDSSRSFYSPLPETPVAPVSEPEVVSDGELTPTDSASLAGSGEDVANDAHSSRAGKTGRSYDVMSESSGMMTPASWSEVGSVISENELHSVRV